MHLFLVFSRLCSCFVGFFPSMASFERDEADSSKHVKTYIARMTMLICDLQFKMALTVDL